MASCRSTASQRSGAAGVDRPNPYTTDQTFRHSPPPATEGDQLGVVSYGQGPLRGPLFPQEVWQRFWRRQEGVLVDHMLRRFSEPAVRDFLLSKTVVPLCRWSLPRPMSTTGSLSLGTALGARCPSFRPIWCGQRGVSNRCFASSASASTFRDRRPHHRREIHQTYSGIRAPFVGPLKTRIIQRPPFISPERP